MSLLAITILGLTISGRELALVGLVGAAIVAAIGWYTHEAVEVTDLRFTGSPSTEELGPMASSPPAR